MTERAGSEAVRRPATALLLAAGSGERLAAPEPKAFVPLRGLPLFVHSLRAMAASEVLEGLVLVVPVSWESRAKELIAEHAAAGFVLDTVVGGRTRQESVRRGLEAVPPHAAIVVCHDAARPFASPRLHGLVVRTLQERIHAAHGVIPVTRPLDTVKRLAEDRVVETVPRDDIGLAQTPQAFQAGALREAHDAAAHSTPPFVATDDAMLLEFAGFTVVTVPGEAGNVKVTSAHDLERAESADAPGSEQAHG